MCFANCAKRTFCAPVASMIAGSMSSPNFTENIAEQVSTSGNVRVFFINEEKSAKGNLNWQVMAADVKMCETIAKLNLPFAVADSLTNILIGRELTNFHYYYYYGFVVYTCCVAHTVSVAWILS